ncbi:MerR family transcriptional regulator [Ktedonobacter racemifer]|uniref:Transcriptional regulator, MerR family n=1 Tax=Ktedonobacter racemifer DSM 44963 TaxID=485913 RepID=D6TRU1_KTERA|nr:MerR family transcriptional regulator [Ktedonobacter racemifer]EFH87871.1 transcriptional regulator, MerR family [Ktedonobacter racemifer DSM 44963]
MEELSIGEVARRTGLRTSAIRYYESINLLPPPRRVSGQRRYAPETVQTLEFVQTARRIGFSLTEIQSLLEKRQGEVPLGAHWQGLVQHKLIEVQNVINQAQTMQHLLVQGGGCSCTTLEECIDCVLANCQ